jgi:hypothetical protein
MLLMESENIYCDQIFVRLNTDAKLNRKEVFTVKKAIFAD